ncbi:hypothetical protein PybrP1_012313 [[Pythium] brassicae (nom. inval.)]|nr:hypothetical protein PybrP1_012313 [[Pythium] brassicae (nom. inval.)]
MGGGPIVVPRTAARPLHQQYESRLSAFSDENSFGKTLPHRSSKRSKNIYSDRFIPSRVSTQLDAGFGLTSDPPRRHGNNQRAHASNNTDAHSSNAPGGSRGPPQGSASNPKDAAPISCASSSFSMLLKSELLGISHRHDYSNYADYSRSYSSMGGGGASSAMSTGNGCGIYNYSTSGANPGAFGSNGGSTGFAGFGSSGVSSNILRFKAPRKSIHDEVTAPISFNGIGCSTQRLMTSGMNECRRKISKTPFKILDAPALQDDFYLNLVDWSAANVLAVGLGSCVYLWSACTSKVTKLCDLGAGHAARVGTLAWGANLIASGSRDRTIYLRDLRAAEPFQFKLAGHKQEVCGLKWSFDDNQLASGGNDNKLFVWNMHGASSANTSNSGGSGTIPMVRYNDHTAAVKAIAWSPHQHGLLASGGGTADRCIRFWNTLTQTAINAIDTGSQVCNLVWSKNVNEVVSTHGYSLNQIIVWKYPSMTKLATLTGHTFRVLYLAMSPDGQTIVTGAGDETLRFWNAFPSSKAKGGSRLGTDLMLPIGIGNEIR